MRTYNRVMLLGHLAADPELRQTQSGISVCTFPLATNRVVKDGSEKREVADFHRIAAWRGLADVCKKYLEKGTAVLIDGRIVNRSFEDKEGNRHFRTEIVADNLNILNWKKAKSGKPQLNVESVDAEDPEEELTEKGEAVPA